MHFSTTLLIALAGSLTALALPAASADAIPDYALEARDAANSTAIDVIACHVNFLYPASRPRRTSIPQN